MRELMLKALKPMMYEMLERARTRVPGMIDALIPKVTAAIAATPDKAAAIFRGVYANVVAKVTAWLPTIKPGLLTQVNKLAAVVKVQIAKL